MKPVFDEDIEGCGYKSYDKAEKPKDVDKNGIPRSLEVWRAEV